MGKSLPTPLIAIACGGTGGHLFPGVAVGEALLEMGADVLLVVSEKEVDQQAVASARDMEVLAVPAVASTATTAAFLAGLWRSFLKCRKTFAARRPVAVLAMGGFTSAGPVLAGRACGAAVFLHEANTIPGRANRVLAPLARECFVMFEGAANRLNHSQVSAPGMPVRSQFQPGDRAAARLALGLDPGRETLLIVGGSQGASGLNDAVLGALPLLRAARPDLQAVHLTGMNDLACCQSAWAASGLRALVRPFLTEMEMALGAADLAVSRAGASSLAEFAAMRLPAILVPYPSAADDHQWHNARAFAQEGASALILQKDLTPARLAETALALLEDDTRREWMAEALERWHEPDCARAMAARILAVGAPQHQPTGPAAWSSSALPA